MIPTLEQVESTLTQLKARRFELTKEIEIVDFQIGNWTGQRTILLQQKQENSNNLKS